MKYCVLVVCLALALVVGCGGVPAPAPTAASVAPISLAVGTPNAGATETVITQHVLATITAAAAISLPSAPTVGATVTPPPPPGEVTPTEPLPTGPPPTLSASLSPSVTPVPNFPTPFVKPQPTDVSTQAPTEVSEATLHGKIMFLSTRNGGKYPNSGQYFTMNADGSDVQPIPLQAGKNLFAQLKPQEGYSPDKSFLVIGEANCNPAGHCDLYIGEPSVVVNRSQGNWPGGGPGWLRADNPVWSPDGAWIAYTWNRDNNRTKNIFKGMPFEKNQDYKRLTDFGGSKDTKDPSYSPDGSQLAFATQDGPHWQVWILDATANDPAGANAHRLTDSDSDNWSPLWIK
jgi:hypothetical protein